MKGTNLTANEIQQLVANYKTIIPYTLTSTLLIDKTYNLTHTPANVGKTQIYNVSQPGKRAYFVNWTDIDGNPITDLTIKDVSVLAQLNYKVVESEKSYLSVALIDKVVKVSSTPTTMTITRKGTYSIATP